ncbi:hypothetical protein F444_18816 [Phytophthora nicotianae P1976]|uniref:DUF6818 domain-containing protein n=1 Tax=Phytophthora nicotianae P1976 TaxID=1317066 RepID=A0A080ZA26_PHYNI|nr:hypothetical protein F444_18816 [Phytophthora nicotianae P1976]
MALSLVRWWRSEPDCVAHFSFYHAADTLPLQPYFASSYFTLWLASNHSLADIDRLLLLVEKTPPLGEDKWDRLALFYNANRPRGAPGRDFESL